MLATNDAPPPVKADDAEIVATITAICNEFEAYGHRRVGAEFRHQGIAVNSKKIRRLMRLQPQHRRRFVVTTDSGPIFPAVTAGMLQPVNSATARETVLRVVAN
jgi:hypothetical protein